MNTINCPQLTKSNKNVVFIENHLPGLESGDYTMTVTQTTGGTGKGGSVKDSFSTDKLFSVQGARFVLAPSVIDSVFPASNHQGDFTNCLPHVTLSAATFPWQRDLGKDAQGQSLPQGTPWVGLMAFTQEEAPEAKKVTLGTFKAPPKNAQLPAGTSAGQMLFYDFTKETGDNDTDPCHVIDVPADLFNQLAPSTAELKHLAHVREVDTISKATPSSHYFRSARPGNTTPSKATFSVLVGNRLLSTSGRYTVHLVSLENMGQYLPDDTGKSNIPTEKKYVRLVSLHHWSFTVMAEKKHLSDIIKALDKSPIDLKLPPIQSTEPDADKLNQALDMGYMPLTHTMRVGGQTVSWYRGPLVPYKVSGNIVAYPQQSADAWVRYDPDIAMFDLSYAAAWQLGRLLGLQSKAFATALYQWKCQNTQATILQLEQDILAQK
ncbi:MAG: hypothetical protein AAFQ78_01865, partial [Bacteroidota bacterium]